MRTNLQVPFSEKDEAKRLGARWDATKRVWYVPNADNLAAFARWLPDKDAAPSPAPSRASSAASIIKTGTRFFELQCSCLPWVGCSACRQQTEARGWNTPD